MSFLTEEMIMDYFKKVICGDIEDHETQKRIIKTFIREIVLYNDMIVIIYNYTNTNYSQTVIPDDIKEFDLDKIKEKLLTEKDINKNMDISIFYSKEYFAVMEKRNK